MSKPMGERGSVPTGVVPTRGVCLLVVGGLLEGCAYLQGGVPTCSGRPTRGVCLLPGRCAYFGGGCLLGGVPTYRGTCRGGYAYYWGCA